MRKPTIRYVELAGLGCGLSTDSERNILRREGTSNVRRISNATKENVEWVRAMGGYVPDGRIAAPSGDGDGS